MPPAVNRPMTAPEWAMLTLLSGLWGGTFLLTHVALTALPPVTLVALRVGLAALVLNLVLPLVGHRLPRAPDCWRAFLGMGFLNNAVPFCLIAWGQTHIASGLAAILNATTPLATVVIAHLLTVDERMTGNRLAGVLVGLCGVTVLVGPALLTGLGSDAVAQIALLGAALSYACAGVFGRRFARMGVAPLVAATGQVSASSLLIVPVALAVDRPWQLPMPGLTVCAAVLAIAVLSTALAFGLYFRILATAGATNLLLVTFLIPAWAIVLGASVLGERFDLRQCLGVALIGCGLVAIDGRLGRRLWRSSPAWSRQACR
jgi:drug/metabolite transporter (DMT)-like permease